MNASTILLGTVLLFSAATLHAQEGSGRHLGRPRANQKGPSKPSKYTLAQFEGRWQESGRTSTKTSSSVPVEDTLYIRFYNGTKADTKEGTSVVVTGTSEVLKDDYLTTSANDYKIVSLSENEMVLDDENGYIHTFGRKDKFEYETVITPPEAVVDTSALMIDVTSGYLAKDWFAYRRKADPGVITNQTPIIRALKINSNTDNNNYKGQIEFSLGGKAIVKPCTINIADDHTASIVTDSNTWNISVYKCDGKELILGDKKNVVYYFKNNN